jgi:NAD(P)-dependent dehydrogenase (short-subunit alcohol dehydrogenase family)
MINESGLRTAVVTGANRGVGREIARQLVLQGYRVIFTSRDPLKGSQSVEKLRQEIDSAMPGELVYHPLDVTDASSIKSLHGFVIAQYGAVDALVNNAAILLDQNGRILHTPLDVYRQTMETNCFGPLLLCQTFIPDMLSRNYGRVVNVSSGAGQIGDMIDDMTAYRLSKIALNGLTRMLADSLRGTNVLVNAACPGWVHSDMGGPEAPRSEDEGAAGIVWLATLPDGGPQCGFFRDGQPIPW